MIRRSDYNMGKEVYLYSKTIEFLEETMKKHNLKTYNDAINKLYGDYEQLLIDLDNAWRG